MYNFRRQPRFGAACVLRMLVLKKNENVQRYRRRTSLHSKTTRKSKETWGLKADQAGNPLLNFRKACNMKGYSLIRKASKSTNSGCTLSAACDSRLRSYPNFRVGYFRAKGEGSPLDQI